MIQKTKLGAAEYARLAVDVAADMQASDILMLDVGRVIYYADFFVILSVDSTRQMAAIAEETEKRLKQEGATLHHQEGTQRSGWMLLDYGDVIIHIFGTEEREYYQLEEAWDIAQEVVRIL